MACRTAAPTPSSSLPAATPPKRCRCTSARRSWCPWRRPHWRLSALPASLAGFRDRGTIRVGGPADIVVYDFENLESRPSEIAHDLPGGEWRRIQRARGYRWVLVNGAITIEDDTQTDVHSGALLRHGG